MARIDPALIEAARDGGANGLQILATIVIPLSKTGIALGSIFVIALIMGDFFVVRIMSGGQSGNVVLAMSNEIALLQYPPAAASAVVLIVIVDADGRGDPADRGRAQGARGLRRGRCARARDRRPWTFYALAAFFALFVLFLYGPMSAIYILSFQGPNGGLTFPMNGVSLRWFARPVRAAAHRRHRGLVRALDRARPDRAWC